VAAQQPVTITGQVTSEAGQPLGNASVFVEGMGLGALSRDDGQYSFTVPAARATGQTATLTARIIGYRAQSRPITLAPGSTVTQNFQLAANPLQLGEVVVTGAGTTTTREKLGNVINSVDSSAIARSPETNVVAALAAKAPNVVIQQQSGEPGASAFIQIRGPKTIQGTGQPLFVVDGVPIDNTTFATGSFLGSTSTPNRASDINPADVASVEILKGAAAAAIYGARAAQGVILITTKSGQAGQTRYSLRSNFGWDEVNQGVPLQQRFGQGYLLDPRPLSGPGTEYELGISCGPSSVPCPPGTMNVGGTANPDLDFGPCGGPGCRLGSQSWGPEFSDETFYPDGRPRTFDHFNEMFGTGFQMEHVLTVSGGNERTNFYFSAGRLDHDGMIVGPNNWYDRTTARLKAQHSLTDRLRIGGNIQYTDARGDFVQKGSNVSGLLLGALRSPPEFDNRQFIDEETGLHRSYRFPRPNARNVTRGYDNPFYVVNEQTNTSDVGRVFGNVSLDYNPLDWLRLAYTFGADYANDERIEANPPSSSTRPTGLMLVTNLINYQLDHNLTATAERSFTPWFAGTLTLGQNLNSRRFRQYFVQGNDWISPTGPLQLDNTVTQIPDEFESVIHTESYFGQVTADLYEQLYLTASLRNDGFSSFGSSDRRHWFPKVSAAWTFTELLGEGTPGFIDFGKVRAAWGQAGREPNAYATITAYTLANPQESWGPFLRPVIGNQGGVRSSTVLGQEDLKPEITTETETGLDLSLFRAKVDMGLTYYYSVSDDVIFSAPLPVSTGFTNQARNAGRIRNQGWELTANYRPITTQSFTLEFGANWARNRNKVLELEGADFVDINGAFAGAPASVFQGHQVGVLRGNDWLRCGISDGSIEVDDEGGATTTLGALCSGLPRGALYLAPDGFPVVDPESRVIMDGNPDWTAGFRTTVTWRGFQVSGLVDVKEGGDVWNGTKGALYTFGTHKDTEIRGQTVVYGPSREVGGTSYPGWQGDRYSRVFGPGADVPIVLNSDWFNGNGGGFGPQAAQFIEDGSYVKLREISVQYSFAQPWVRRATGLSSIDLRLAGRNLKTWTDYTGVDPETNLGGAEVQMRGVDYFNNPNTRSWLVSVGLNR
jgi:TonB-linked SusC/RagA family outer membrane protein